MQKGLALRLLGGFGIAALAAILWAQTANLAIKINGTSVAGKTLASQGQTYVPVSALKAAGAKATIQDGTLHITFAPSGGANQVEALEGEIGEWLFNGIWRLRVNSVVPSETGRPGWTVNVELRNGSKVDNLALAGSGFKGLNLVMADGNSLGAYNQTALVDKPINQASGVTVGLIFHDDQGQGRKPDKLILMLKPDDFTKNLLLKRGATFSVSDPSFRVKLSEDE